MATLRVGNALIAVLQHDEPGAQEQYDDLLQSRSVLARYALTVGMPLVHRVLGILAQTSGNLDQAVSHFEDALTFCRKAGYRPELAWTCCDYADMLLDPSTSSGQAVSDNRAKAMSLLDESLAISSDLGMRPLMERVLSRREILKA